MLKFDNKKILVTGASRGIGRAIASAFAARGGTVALNFRNDQQSASDTLSSLEGKGHLLVQADVSNPDGAKDAVDKSLAGTSGTFYRARASILSNDLRDLPNKFRLVPGMLLSADIKTGRRRLITYFIYPIIRTIQTSFSEPGR